MDSITAALCEQLQRRAERGLSKYGVSAAERDDLSRVEWLRHAQEEALDLAVYLEKLIQEESRLTDSDVAEIEADIRRDNKKAPGPVAKFFERFRAYSADEEPRF